MRVLLTSEARFERTPDGVVWGAAPYGFAMWRRYLDVFASALLVARVADVRQPSAGSVEASGPGLHFCALPPYEGLGGLLRHIRHVRAAVGHAVGECQAAIVRSPSPIASLTSRAVLAAGRTYGAHIVGDPDQVFSAGAFRHPLRAPLRRFATTAQKRLSRDATAVLFVTRHVLQTKYPTRGRAYSASDVSLDDADFVSGTVRSRGAVAPYTLVAVAALDQPYKGIGVLLDAVAQLQREGSAIRLRVVGAGRLLPDLRRQAHALGLARFVEFRGQVDRAGVRHALESADLFVLPSLTEGLPRALLEAMAQGLPAVASDVGGVPELLAPDCLVPPGQARLLADRIQRFLASETMLVAAGERNRQVARAYHEREQTAIRKAFLLSVAADVQSFAEAVSA